MTERRCPASRLRHFRETRRSSAISRRCGPSPSGSPADRSIRWTRVSSAATRRAEMANRPDGRIRLTVLGGFLGSGKTTWLRHQLHEGVFEGAFVVVNEAAETPVDDVLLTRSSSIAVLAGGCACCEAKGELIGLLRRI